MSKGRSERISVTTFLLKIQMNTTKPSNTSENNLKQTLKMSKNGP
jgi:hypothetical protein